MKRCPECRRDYYDDSLVYCLDDGAQLLEGPAGVPEPATVSLRSPESHRGNEADTRHYSSGDVISEEIKRHKVGVALVIGIVAVLIAGFAYGLYRFLAGPSSTTLSRSANIETRRLTGDGKTNEAAISPDGKVLVYTRTEGDRTSLWIKQIQTDSNIQVPTSDEQGGMSNLIFSPDGSFIYFNGGRTGGVPTVYRVPTFGGAPAKVLTNAILARFSADGKQVAFARPAPGTTETVFFIANADGSHERKIASRSGRQFFNAFPTWSPDGRYIAVSAGDDSLLPAPDESVVLISTADGSETELGKKKWASVSSLSWDPSGDLLIAVASDYDVLPGQLWEIAYPSGEARRLTNNLNGYRLLSMTADGKAIVTMERYSRSAIWISPDLDPAKAKPIMPSTGDTWGFTWTPDGRIVYVSDQSGDAEVWIMNADGSSAKQLTRDRVFKGFPDVSSDGRFIVYASADGGGRLKRIDINGGEPVAITETGFGQDNADISPDDRWSLFSAWVDGAPRILRAPLSGGGATVLTSVDAEDPRYSPDGSQFACFAGNEKTRLAIYPADGGEPVKQFELPDGTVEHRGPLWTPDGRGITIHVSKGEHVNLWVQPVDGGPLRQLTDFTVPYVARRDYSRDGKRIGLIMAENIRNAVMITGFR